jgi:hypothetical protein
LVEQALMVGPTARLIEEKKPAELTRQTIAREIEAAFAAEASSGPIRLPTTTAGHEISSPMSPTAREKPWVAKDQKDVMEVACVAGGTGGSNPLSSSRESGANCGHAAPFPDNEGDERDSGDQETGMVGHAADVVGALAGATRPRSWPWPWLRGVGLLIE